MTAPPPKVLLTGATGYLGGTLLHQLINSQHAALQDIVYTCTIRGEDRIPKIKTRYGDRVMFEVVNDLDNGSLIEAIASAHDIVINAAYSSHVDSAEALVTGLSHRVLAGRPNVLMLHTSGMWNLADRPITNPSTDQLRVLDDEQDDIYAHEKALESKSPYAQRTVELRVIDAGLETGVKVISIMPPTIFGVGTGAFNKRSVQVPAYVDAALYGGRAVVVGQGDAMMDHVHCNDLAELYALILVDFISNKSENLPQGTKAIMFAENGRQTWYQVAQNVANTAHQVGLLPGTEVKSISLTGAAQVFAGGVIQRGDEDQIEVYLCSNGLTRSSLARKLGWQPTRGNQDWIKGFMEEVQQSATGRILGAYL